jgi:hypothetical protein
VASGKLRRYVLTGLAVAGFATVVVGVGALRTYHEVTKIDRGVPTVVVREYVDAVLVRRDANRASLFSCRDSHDLAPLWALSDQLIKEERDSGVTTQVVPSRLSESEGGRQVTADIKLNQGSGVHVDRRTQTWQFTVKDEDGWRVCGATQILTPSPSATPPTAS